MPDDIQLPPDSRIPKLASDATIAKNRAVLSELDFTDQRCFEDAQRGFIATLDPIIIAHDRLDRESLNLEALGFLDQEAPDTVNPSLWRQARLNARHHGLFEVVDGIYQIRSFDIANMTLIKGSKGWIIIDPLTCTESARAGLDLANRELGERPVTGVIITHSHVDHYAGILGVITQEDAESGKVPVIAPEHFVDEALSENVLAGNAMNRRATYMYGNLLPPAPIGFVSTGLGASLAMGSTSFVIPNDLIKVSGETRTIDGVDIEFQMTPGTEAPAEMVFYFPQFRALCMSEIATHHMHNVYTPRGTQVRDALAWSAQINESIQRFGDRLEVEFASHHWPIWGRKRVVDFLTRQRDLYKYIHDQTLRLANLGYVMDEIAELISLPASLGKEFFNRDYYGTVHHNARAVYVKYLGYFDGNPAHLYPLPPIDRAVRYVDYMGGADAVLGKARESFDAGDYRWVAEVLNHLVMADPGNLKARALLADALEQLGYQAESGPWRNFFLSGALELRNGVPEGSLFKATESMARSMPLEHLFLTLAVRLNGPRADGVRLHINLEFDDGDHALLCVENAVLHGFIGKQSDNPMATLRLSVIEFKRLMLGLTDAGTLMEAGVMELDGDPTALMHLAELFDQFERRFPIMTPRPPPT